MCPKISNGLWCEQQWLMQTQDEMLVTIDGKSQQSETYRWTDFYNIGVRATYVNRNEGCIRA